jgi:hypothetical protein
MGTIDTTDLMFPGPDSAPAAMTPLAALIVEGGTAVTLMSQYSVTTFPPGMNFGTGGVNFASSGSGDQFGADGQTILVPDGYVSGHTLNATDTYLGQTFATLGLTPGTYKWTWGTGSHADFLTLQIGAVPEPSTAILAVIGAGSVIAFGLVRKRRAQRRQAAA